MDRRACCRIRSSCSRLRTRSSTKGTFPLPEAQLDRFFLKTALGYPTIDEEMQIVDEQRHGHPLRWLEPVVDVDDIRAVRDAVTTVYVDPLLQRWIVELVRATRNLDEVAVGASVRGSLALERAARAWALLDHRPYVVPEDIDRLFAPVLLHRVVFRPTFLAEARRVGWNEAVEGIERKCFAAAPRPEPEPVEVQPAPEPVPVARDQH